MRIECERVLELLASEGALSLENDKEAAAHEAACEDCQAFVVVAAELDEALAALPVIDAPDALVERLLARPELQRSSRLRSPWLLSSAAAVLLILVGGYALFAPEDRRAFERNNSGMNVEPQNEAEREAKRRMEESLGYVESGKRQNELSKDVVGEGAIEAAPDAERQPSEFLRVAPQVQLEDRLERNVPRRADDDAKLDKGEVGFSSGIVAGLEEPPPPPPPPPIAEPNVFELTPDEIQVGSEAELDARASALEGLEFLEPSGYWANTYLPGDPRTRLLAARLAELDATARFRSWAADLHERAVRVDEPFDAPESRALSIYFDGDRAAVSEPTRMIVQVGLKAAERHARRRPSMNLGLAFDLRGTLPIETARKLRALGLAFAEARESGDRFRLLAPGSEPIEPDAFDRDRIAALFNADARTDEGALAATLEQTIRAVADAEDADAVLGTSSVVLVIDRPLLTELAAVERLARRSAVSGIPVSVIAVGNALPAEVERVALAGQGSRWLVEAPADAARVVEAELAASSRVVARAVRLRIRLADGVELVSVLGSRRLDAVASDQVREAERSLDQRLARNLGIEADRGDDEAGIQILIPALYAGDTHVILLDVVVPGAGPVGDVTARFKDIGALRNEVARASLALASGERAEGPLQTNVRKNLLAHRLSEALEAAGDRLAQGDPAAAIERLTVERDAFHAATADRPLLDDADLHRDVAMLEQYLTFLHAGVASEPVARDYLATSLQYASRIKLQTPLALQ